MKRMDIQIFTPRAQRALSLAHEEVQTLRQPYVGPEHILLGLLQEHRGMAAQIIIERGLNLRLLRKQIIKAIQQGSTPLATEAVYSGLEYSQQAKHVLAMAAERARKLGHATIGTEHILLGILSVRDCIGSHVLRTQGITADSIYQDVLLRLDSERPSAWKRYALPLSIAAGAVMFAGTGSAVTVSLVRRKRRHHSLSSV
jgi:ATP-dependent Clp protease ATP-binding subunit ClpC